MSSTTDVDVAYTACAGAMHSSTGAGAAYPSGAGEIYSPTAAGRAMCLTTGAGTVYNAGAGAQEQRKTLRELERCSPRQLQVQRPLKAPAQCTRPRAQEQQKTAATSLLHATAIRGVDAAPSLLTAVKRV